MASNLKNYPPSEEKIKELRSTGVLPRSKDLIIAAVLIGISFSLVKLVFPNTFAIKDILTANPEDYSLYVKTFIFFFFKLAFTTILFPILILVLFLGLLQNKFYINFGLLSFRMERLFAFFKFFTEFNKRFLGALTSLLFLVIAFFCFMQIINFYSSNITKYFQNLEFSKNPAGIFLASNAGQNSLFTFILFILFVMAIIVRFFSVLFYRKEHAMSREELEAESREQEMSSDMKRLLRSN